MINKQIFRAEMETLLSSYEKDPIKKSVVEKVLTGIEGGTMAPDQAARILVDNNLKWFGFKILKGGYDVREVSKTTTEDRS